MVKKFISFWVTLRQNTTLKIHNKLTKMGWYKSWHETKYHKHVHVAVLVIYVLAIFAGIINVPSGASAAWNNTAEWTTKADFDSNAVTTGTGTTNTLVDTTSASGSAKLTKPTDIGNTISAGWAHSLVVKNDGTVWGTGQNNTGALGTGDYASKDSFVQIATDASSVSGGNTFSLMIKKDGTVWGTGYNGYGMLGIGNTTTKNVWTQSSPALTGVKQVSAGYNHSVALKSDGTVWTTGYNNAGQLGIGAADKTNRSVWTQVINANVASDVVSVTAGNNYTVVVKSDGTVWGTGANNYGSLGVGDAVNKDIWTQATAFSGITKVFGYYNHTLAIKNDGTVWGAGWNNNGGLGLGHSVQVNTWTQTDLTNVADVSTGGFHSIALKADGTVWVCGAASNGALGAGDNVGRPSWTQLNVSNITGIAAGAYHSILRKSDGSTMITGNNTAGQLGNGDVIYRGSWQETSFRDPVQLSSGNGQSIMARKADGNVYGLGYNGSTHLGIDANSTNRFTFTKSSITNVTKVQMTGNYVLAIKADGTLWAIGYNNVGQLGLGDTTARNTWTQVTALSGIVDISANNTHSMALKNDGTVYVTGANGYSQMGNGNTTSITSWTAVPAIAGATKITAGTLSSFAIKDGELWVAGYNSTGNLGLGNTTSPIANWTKSATVSNVSKVWSEGVYHSIIQKTDGTIWTTGSNSQGELGLGDYTNRSTWTQLIDFTNAIGVSISGYHTFIIKSDNTLWTTGTSDYGEMGTGNIYERRNTFTQVATDVAQVSMSPTNSIIAKTDGKVYTVGWNNNGSLGVPLAGDGLVFSYINSLTNVKRDQAYYSTGIISNLKINAGVGKVYKWNAISWANQALPAGTSIKFRTRGSTTEGGLASATWSDYYLSSGAPITTANSQWLEVEMALATTDGLNTPTLDSFSINYFTDITAPGNPVIPASAWNSSGKAVSIANNNYKNANRPYFEFTGATDEAEGSGVKGYYVYFGSSNSADPYTAGTYQAHVTDPQTFTAPTELTTDGTYYLRVRTEDNANNLTEPTTIFVYRYDSTAPDGPSSVLVSPFGWSAINKYSFSWDTAIDSGEGYSDIAGYQYKLGGTANDWSGVVTTTQSRSVADKEAYQNGQNVFYIRSIDNAGNTGDVKQVYYYYNGSAPSKPLNVQVDTQLNTENEFTFTWDEPATHDSDIKGYYYSVNSEPTITNSVYTEERTTGQIHAANKQGLNKFYVAAVDVTNDSLLGTVSDFVGFDCNTPAPGVPTGLMVSDSSNLIAKDWALTSKWLEPDLGVVDKYNVYRSSDGVNFVNIAETKSTGYLDSDVANTSTYHYKITALDNAGSESAFSSVIPKKPTGKFVTPPLITEAPEIKSTASGAAISWITDRPSSSFVAYSKNLSYSDNKGQLDSVTTHKVLLTGLEPGTTYNYKLQSFDENREYPIEDSMSGGYSFTTQSAPGIAEVQISDIRLTSAIVSWKTTTVATSTLLYGKTNGYGQIVEDKSGSSVTTHTVKLEGLDHTSTYHFRIKGTDTDGNLLISDDYSFDTLTYPRISDVKFEQQKNTSTSTVKVVWSSNVPITSVVEYAESTGSYQEVSKSTLETKHSMLVSGLRDNTAYRIVVRGRDSFGTEAISDVNTVKTDFDTRPPEISNITSEVSATGIGSDTKGQAVVSWETDEASSSQVEFGVGVMGDNYDIKTQEDTTPTTSHVVIITGLKPSTSYHFRVVSADSSRNISKSEPQSIITEQASSSVFTVIINSLQNSIGWIFGWLN